MTDAEFLTHVFSYAAMLKQSTLTDAERQAIINEFNSLSGDAHSRAQTAIRKVLNIGPLVEEIRKSANLDNTDRLLTDLQNAAAKWQASKK